MTVGKRPDLAGESRAGSAKLSITASALVSILPPVLAAAILAGCVARADVDQVQSEQSQLRTMAANNQQQVQILDNRLRRLEGQIQQLQQSPSSASMPGQVDKIASLEDRLNRLEASVTALQASAGSLPPTEISHGPPPGAKSPVEREPSLGGGPAGGSSATGGSPTGGSSAAVAGSSFEADLDTEIEAAKSSNAPGVKYYREGLAAMREGKYPAAIEKFAMLQKKFPKSPLTEQGEYFSANSFYELGKHDQAILQFNDLVMRFPKGRFASQALLREAQAFLKINDKIDARLTLNKLISDHPDSPQASVARDMMRDLES